MNILFSTLTLLNTVWFGAAFWLFSIKSNQAAKLLLSKENRQQPFYSILSHSLKSLGGMNLSLTILSIMSLVSSTFGESKTLLLLVFASAHGSQFLFNVPIAFAQFKKEKPLWNVLTGNMFFIFVVDFILFIFNLALANIFW